MADRPELTQPESFNIPTPAWRMSVDEARAFARERFRDRLANGEQIGNCSCSEEESGAAEEGPGTSVVGVRFRDSAQVFFFSSPVDGVEPGTWVVARTSRGEEAGRVVVAPKQIALSQLDGDLRPIERVMTPEDVDRVEALRAESARVIRRGGELSRYHDFRIKVIGAEFALDGQALTVYCSAPEEDLVEDLRDVLELEFGVDIEMRPVGARDEARLIGGLGKCGRTLCCSSWLPMYPDVSMGMAKMQDLSLNPGKVTGLCGRLLCCLSYENEQYKKAKQVLPRLGQKVSTPDGDGIAVSLQILKELVTVRLDETGRDQTYPAADLLGNRKVPSQPVAVTEAAPDPESDSEEPRARRRRRRRRRPAGETPA